MPFYEYRCDGCGEIFEVLQKIGALGGDEKCPKCGSDNCKRLMSAASVLGGSASEVGGSGGCQPQGGFSWAN